MKIAPLLAFAAGLAATVASWPSRAIDYEPLDWVPVPRGTQVLALYYEYGQHNSYNNTLGGTFSGDTHLNSEIGLVRYIHYSESSLFGHQWDWNVILPFGRLRDGRIDGQSLGDASGVGDPIASVGYFLVDQPEQKRWLTFAPYVTIPIGSYDKNKPINIGGNRWIYNFQGDFTQGLSEKFTLDLAAGWTWYGDNTEAGNGSQRLTQETSYELYGWLVYDVTDLARRAWQGASNAKLSLGWMGLYGGEQKLDGVLNGQKVRQDQLRLAYMMNFSPTVQGLLQVSRDVHLEGGFKQNFGLTARLVKAF